MSCNQTKARRPINKNIKSSEYEYSVLINKTLYAEEENKIRKYVLKDSLLSYATSPYGFSYAKLKGNRQLDKKPTDESIVTYLKTVYSLNDELIYSQIEKTIKVGKSNEVKGIKQGLKLMQEDEEFKFIFSSFVSHGFSGDGYKIGPNKPIVVNIKLLKIK